jgi:hypothetical protein
VDFGQVNPALPDPQLFDGFVSSSYWSSTTYQSFPDLAWFVGFNVGNVYADGKNFGLNYVLAVRGGS